MKEGIRVAQEEDFKEVFAIYFIEEVNQFLQYNSMSPQRFRKLWDRMINSKRIFSYVYVRDEKVEGFISWKRKGGQAKHVAVITPIIIKPHLFNKGIGKKLMRFALKEIRESKVKKVDMEVNADNTRALNFFRKFGFEREATIKKASKKNGRYFSDFIMVKHLN